MTLATDLQGNHKPVILVELLFDSGPIRFWTRPFSGQANGETYKPLAGLTGSLSVKHSLDQSSLEASAQLSGSSTEIIAAALTEQFQRRTARISLGALDEDGNLTSSEVMIPGKMQDIPLIDAPGDGPSATVRIESLFADIAEASNLRLSAADQAQFSDSDTFFDLVETATVTEPRFGG